LSSNRRKSNFPKFFVSCSQISSSNRMRTSEEILTEYFESENHSEDMPSRNHAKLQSNLVFALIQKYGTKYHIFSQVGIKLNQQTTIPDVCAYPKTDAEQNFDWFEDELHLNDPPEIVFEIVSPQQGTQELLAKFKAYFEAGVQSCWMINPLIQSVYIYSPPFQQQGFLTDKIHDNTTHIELDIQDLFRA